MGEKTPNGWLRGNGDLRDFHSNSGPAAGATVGRETLKGRYEYLTKKDYTSTEMR